MPSEEWLAKRDELKRKIQERLAQRKQWEAEHLVPADPPPRYDDVFFEGLRALDGEGTPTEYEDNSYPHTCEKPLDDASTVMYTPHSPANRGGVSIDCLLVCVELPMRKNDPGVRSKIFRSALNGLVKASGGSMEKVEKVLADSWEPGSTDSDKRYLLAEAANLIHHPLAGSGPVAVVKSTGNPLEDYLASLEPKKSPGELTLEGDDVMEAMLQRNTGIPVEQVSPLWEAMKVYAEEAASYLEQKKHFKLSFSAKDGFVEVHGQKYILMYTAVMTKGNQTVQLNGGTGNTLLSNLGEDHLGFPLGKSRYAHDSVFQGSNVVFRSFAVKLEPGLKYRFWVSTKTVGGSNKDLLKYHVILNEKGSANIVFDMEPTLEYLAAFK